MSVTPFASVDAAYRPGPVSLLDLDPDFGALLPADRLEAARRDLQVRPRTVAPGPWPRPAGDAPHAVLVLEGILAREIVLADTVSTDLVGAGDLAQPWDLPGPDRSVRHTVRWTVLAPSRVVLLDRGFLTRLAAHPDVNAALLARAGEQLQRLALMHAIVKLTRVDQRLLALFWHLADRWGRVTTEGVLLPLTVSHRMLATLVGARRPTVSTALGRLAERNELVRRADGTWLLPGQPVGQPLPELERVVPIRRRFAVPLPADANGGRPLAAG